MVKWIATGLFLAGFSAAGLTVEYPVPLYTSNEMDFGQPIWIVSSAVSGRYVEIFCAADENALYIKAIVPDLTPEQPYSGLEMFRGDSLQIAFDPLNDKMLSMYAPDDYEYGFSFRDGKPEITCWASGEPEISTHGISLTGGYDESQKAYRYFIRFPWERLSPFAPSLFHNQRLGCCVLVNDSQNGERHYVETRPGIFGVKNPAAFDTLLVPLSPRPPRLASADENTPVVTIEWPAEADDENRVRYSIRNPHRLYGVMELALHFGTDSSEIPARSWTVVKTETTEGYLYFRAPWAGNYHLRLSFWDLARGTCTALAEHTLARSEDAFTFPDPRLDPLAESVSSDVLDRFRAAIPYPAKASENSFERWLIRSGWETMLAVTLRHQSIEQNPQENAPSPFLPPVVLKPTDPTRNALDVTLAWPSFGEALGRIRGVRYEHEGLALLVGNLQSCDVTLKITRLFLANEQASLPINLLRAQHTTAAEGATVPDALPPVSDGIVTVPAGGLVQLYLDIAFDGPPGTYTGVLEYLLIGGTSQHFIFPLHAVIVPAALPKPMPIDLCVWPEYSYRHESFDPDGYSIIRDMWDHHVNVYHLYGHIRQDEEGQLSPNPEWHWLIDQARRPGWQLLVFSVFTIPVRIETFENPESLAELERQIRWMMDYLEHTEGLERSEYAFYIMDEPSGDDDKTEVMRRFGLLAKRIAPDLRIYINPGDKFTPALYEEFSKTMDIFCPVSGLIFYPGMGRMELNSQYIKMMQQLYKPEEAAICPDVPWLHTGRSLSPETLRLLSEKGARVWSYDCAGSAKILPVVDYYRKKGFGSWHFGLTGFGFWSYNNLPREHSSWTVSYVIGDYELVYPGYPGIITSRRWEACRDAAEDYTLCWLIERKAESINDPAKAARLRNLVRDGAARVVNAEVNQGKILYMVREKMLDGLVAD